MYREGILKFISWTLLFVVVIIYGGNNNDYFSYHKKIYNENNNISKNILDNFDINRVQNRDNKLLFSPDKTIIDTIIYKIDNAKSRIYLETYIFTEKRILKAILDKKLTSKIDIKIILEKNVFGNSSINKKTFESLKSAGINVEYASEKNYNFTHSKFFIIDNEYIISTGNISYSSFTINREFYSIGSNLSDLEYLLLVFLSDYNKTKFVRCNDTIISSPNCSRTVIENILKSAKNEILIYEQSIDDENIKKILKEKNNSGVTIKILIGDKEKVKNNEELINDFIKEKIMIKSPKKPYIHAKAFLVDSSILFLGSINFTYNSIENNREIGIVFKNEQAIIKFKNEFERLFKNVQ